MYIIRPGDVKPFWCYFESIRILKHNAFEGPNSTPVEGLPSDGSTIFTLPGTNMKTIFLYKPRVCHFHDSSRECRGSTIEYMGSILLLVTMDDDGSVEGPAK